VYAGVDAESRLATYRALGILDRVPAPERAALEQAVAACPPGTVHPSGAHPVGAGT
jgi:hypothetical protein